MFLFLLSFVCFVNTFHCKSKPSTMSTSASVKGILQDTAGNPIPDAIVMIVGGPQEINDIASVSNERGEFFVSNVVVPGIYTLQIQAQNGTKRKEVNISSKDSVIRITF